MDAVTIHLDRKAAVERYKHNKKVHDTGIGEYIQAPKSPNKVEITVFTKPMAVATAKFYHDYMGGQAENG